MPVYLIAGYPNNLSTSRDVVSFDHAISVFNRVLILALDSLTRDLFMLFPQLAPVLNDGV